MEKNYNTRIAVERVNSYLKEWYQLGNATCYNPKKNSSRTSVYSACIQCKKLCHQKNERDLQQKEIAV